MFTFERYNKSFCHIFLGVFWTTKSHKFVLTFHYILHFTNCILN
jgi:hypothetical protein